VCSRADEFLGDGDDYTFSAWDRFSGTIHPTSKDVESVMGSIVLLTQQHEIKLINSLRDTNHSLIANGQPTTRTLREALRVGPGGSTVAGGPAGATLHFREDSPQSGATQTHLFTPMTLNRCKNDRFAMIRSTHANLESIVVDGGQRVDLDPKYNASCAGTDGGEREYMSALCVGRNIGDSLDFGVTTFLYDGLFKNEAGEVNILHDMFPTTARRLDEGLIVGRERVIVRAMPVPTQFCVCELCIFAQASCSRRPRRTEQRSGILRPLSGTSPLPAPAMPTATRCGRRRHAGAGLATAYGD